MAEPQEAPEPEIATEPEEAPPGACGGGAGPEPERGNLASEPEVGRAAEAGAGSSGSRAPGRARSCLSRRSPRSLNRPLLRPSPSKNPKCRGGRRRHSNELFARRRWPSRCPIWSRRLPEPGDADPGTADPGSRCSHSEPEPEPTVHPTSKSEPVAWEAAPETGRDGRAGGPEAPAACCRRRRSSVRGCGRAGAGNGSAPPWSRRQWSSRNPAAEPVPQPEARRHGRGRGS